MFGLYPLTTASLLQRIPSPRNQSLVEDDTEVATARAYLVDTWHDPLRGVVCLLQVRDDKFSGVKCVKDGELSGSMSNIECI